MDNNKSIVVILALAILIVVAYKAKMKNKNSQIAINPPFKSEELFAPKIAEPEVLAPITEPKWENYPPLREKPRNMGNILADVESHLPRGHIYADSDRITHTHEGTHGINSDLRQKHPGKNCFYCLNNKFIILNSPNTNITKTAKIVPPTLRGDVYGLYLVSQAQSWNDTPLYIFDEWVAYTNGSEARLDLGISNRSETVLYALEFNVYSISVAMSSKTEDEKIKTFLMWNIERVMKIYEDSKKFGINDKQENYLNKMRTNPDAKDFREFSKKYFGESWTKKTLGF